MNRIFHARIAMGQYLFLILIGILAVYMLWYKSPFLAAIFMLWLVVIIEKLIHTTYTVTPDGKLVLSFGRFSRSKEILMKDITSVERASSMQVGRFAVMRYVLVKYGEGKCAVLLPVKEEEFIRLLEERRGRAIGCAHVCDSVLICRYRFHGNVSCVAFRSCLYELSLYLFFRFCIFTCECQRIGSYKLAVV